MNYIHLTAKKGGHVNQTTLDALYADRHAHLEAEELKGSTGVYGKHYEPIVRHMLTAKGLLANDMHARTNGNSGHWKSDGMLCIAGEWLSYEVKSGDGIVGNLDPTETPSWTEEDILPGIDLIIYAADPRSMQSEADVLNWSVVLTRAEFLSFIAENGPKRSQTVRTATKAGTNGQYLRDLNKTGGKWKDCITLQATYHEARARACKSKRYKKLGEFLQECGRA